MELTSASKKWDDNIAKAKKSSAKEIEQFDKDLLKEIDGSYTTFHIWRSQHETDEIRPLYHTIAKINAAKKAIWQWQKKVIEFFFPTHQYIRMISTTHHWTSLLVMF
jgi:hypothetical protein